jgi:DNA-binding Lrp family transcriptional regulator
MLSETDRRIIYELDFNARKPVSWLARKLRISKQALAYRLGRLEQEKIIQGYYADINPSKLGFNIYILYFKFQHLSHTTEKEFIEHVNKHSRISVNASVHGKWDHSIAIFARDIYEFNAIYNDLMKNYEKFVKEKLITIVTDFWYYKPKYLTSPVQELSEIHMSGPITDENLDNIDRKLLSILAEHARLPLTELAKKIGLTANAVKNRIKELEKKEVILGYRVMLDHEKLEKLHYRIFFFLENIPARQEAFRKFLALQPQVISITKTIGLSQIECRIFVDDVTGFYKFMEEVKTKFSDILKDFEPLIYYKFHKALNYYPLD